MSEILFYHLQNRPLEAVLPTLLAKSLERGWRVVVEIGTPERLEAIDGHLWTYTDESFLPHGTAADGNPAEQPIFLATDHANPNGATVRFLVDRAAPPPDVERYERLVLIFDGGDPDALAAARGHWKTLKAAGHQVSYWQETARGGWERKG